MFMTDAACQPAAIYPRVSSDRQKENHTIASQTAALIEYAQTHEYSVPPEWIFQDEGYSGPLWSGQAWSLCAIWPPRDRLRRR